MFSFNPPNPETTVPWDSGLCVRAVAIYTSPDYNTEPVKVCPSHSTTSDNHYRSPFSNHLIRCSQPNAAYLMDPRSGRHSVLTPLNPPQPGCSEVPLGHKFMDLGSCPGGINRRETAVIFTLEHAGEIYGRKVLPVRICTCTKRDMETEEKQVEKNRSNNEVSIVPDQKKGKVKVEKREAFWVLAYGKDNYEALKQMGTVLESKDGGDVAKYKDIMER